MWHVFQKPSLAREYSYGIIAIVIVIMGISFWGTWSTYQTLQKERKLLLKIEANQVVSALMEPFDYMEHHFHFVGEMVSNSEHQSPEAIAFILKEKVNRTSNIKRDVFTWTFFDFITPEGFVIASSAHGVLPKPIKIEKHKRHWIEVAPRKPWKLHLASPDIGITSGELIIPAGYGITDKKERFLGILSVGFNLYKLSNKIEHALKKQTSSYLLLDEHYKVVAQSSNHTSSLYQQSFKEKMIPLLPSDITQSSEGFLKAPLQYGNVTYHYYRYIPSLRYLGLIGENTEFAQQQFESLIYPRLINNIVLGLFFIVLLYFFHRYIVMPMVHLSQTAQALSQGNYDTKIPSGGSVEVSHLADALHQIKHLILNVESARVEAEVARSHLKDLNYHLEERSRELEKALKVKTEFLNNLNHEIRSPIHGVMASAEALLYGWETLPNERRYEWVRHILKFSLRLHNFVNNILDISKMEAGKMNYSFAWHDVIPMIQELLEEYGPYAMEQKKTQLTFEYPPIPCECECDAFRIGQVLRNILGNAVKFTKPLSIIEITVSRVTFQLNDGTQIKGIECQVKDEGMGIPDSELAEIFQPFTQSSRTKPASGGTGLGLAIAKEIMEAHRGKIIASNNLEKEGAIFMIQLPLYPSEIKEGNEIVRLIERKEEERKKEIAVSFHGIEKI